MSSLLINKETIKKLDIPGPRYTSYPTAPEWTTAVDAKVYRQKLAEFGKSDKTLSLYIHIPFCQSLCSFCGCNVIIRPREDKYGDEYLEYVSKEIDLIRKAIGSKKTIRQFHLGGGTPTYLTESQLERLVKKVEENFKIDYAGEVAIEIDPRTIDQSKMKCLRRLGFNRLSMGIQDFNASVQEQVNRIQPFDMVKTFYDWCRQLKFQSVNCDLIYGLPGQTPDSFKDTIAKIVTLKPDRIALYSFAYVPWLKKHQSKIAEGRLPTTDQKLDIFLNSRAELLAGGYQAIAMDHFALKDDEMSKAFNNGALYRNFMGYTVKPADEYIGVGITAIGFLENTFIQSHKTLKDYFGALKKGELPVERGRVLSRDDQVRQWVINSFMCRFHVDKEEFKNKFDNSFDDYFLVETPHINKCIAEGLLVSHGDSLEATDLGKIFIRNVCMGFDWYLRQAGGHRKCSRTV